VRHTGCSYLFRARPFRYPLGMFARSLTGVLLLINSGALVASDQESRNKAAEASPVFPGLSAFPPPVWPQQPKAPDGAPNILVIMTDDVGFAAASTFGGSIPTPTFDALAKSGLKFNNFNTTAICSPTRAALLTGRNPHAIQFGSPTATIPSAFDGYQSVLPKSAATIAEILKEHGYSTGMFGKSHLTPEWEQSPQVGPFDHWPTGLGFQYFYGFINADTDQFAPTLVEGTTLVQPPTNDPNYILDRDLADHAIEWIRQLHAVAPNKPFFAYYASGSTHAPQQAPKDWIASFKGKFDIGWDKLREEIFARQKAMGIIPADAKLTPRPDGLLAWKSLSPDDKRIAERYMEVYAAQLAFCDSQIGRVIDYLRRSGQLENTLIFYIQGDNGASSEGGQKGQLYEQAFINHTGVTDTDEYRLSRLDDMGGPSTYEVYPAEWAWAMDTPFQWFKQIASHFGGTRNALVVSWPGRIKQVGGIRQQYSYINDITPTILEVTGIQAPKEVDGVLQLPIDGTSLAYAFDDSSAKTRHTVQYIEMEQNVSIYKDGWVAATTPIVMPWNMFKHQQQTIDLDKRQWELYNVDKDFSEGDDLARKNSPKLAEMQQVFLQEGLRYKVFPVHAPSEGAANRPSLASGRTVFSFPSRLAQLYQNDAPPIAGRSFSISADVDLGTNTENGVLIAQGGQFSGYSFYMKEGRIAFCYNDVPPFVYTIRSDLAVSAGHHVLTMDFTYDGGKMGAGGGLALSVDGQQLARGRVEHSFGSNWISHSEGLDVGQDLITAVSSDYTVPAAFTGHISSVTLTLK
jgi:arylsulfatase A-like enzyme